MQSFKHCLVSSALGIYEFLTVVAIVSIVAASAPVLAARSAIETNGRAELQFFQRAVNHSDIDRSAVQSFDQRREENRDAVSFCKCISELSKSDMTELFGAPIYVGSNSGLFANKAVRESEEAFFYRKRPLQESKLQNGLYFFGIAPFIIRLKFYRNHCVSAVPSYYNDDRKYNLWRASSLASYAIGKSEAEISRYEGQSPQRSTTSVTGVQTLHIFDGAKGSEQFVTYNFGHDIVVVIKFSDGLCTAVEAIDYTLASFGGAYNQSLLGEARFRMPTRKDL